MKKNSYSQFQLNDKNVLITTLIDLFRVLCNVANYHNMPGIFNNFYKVLVPALIVMKFVLNCEVMIAKKKWKMKKNFKLSDKLFYE